MKSLIHLAAIVLLLPLTLKADAPAPLGHEFDDRILAIIHEASAIKPGQTRADLEKAFKGCGGRIDRMQRVYMYRGCRLILVYVTFEAVGQSNPGEESGTDKIVTISKPFLDFPAME